MAAEGDTVQHFSHDMETHWANVFIENNTITNCATVTDNYSSYERAAISVMGSNITSGALPQGVHQCINAAVRHNYISAKGNGIRVEYAKNIVVEGNVISSLGTSNNNDYGIVMRHNTPISTKTIYRTSLSTAYSLTPVRSRRSIPTTS